MGTRTRKRHAKWQARMLRILEREGPLSTAELRAHPKMKNCTLGDYWIRERLRELDDVIEYDYSLRKWRAT